MICCVFRALLAFTTYPCNDNKDVVPTVFCIVGIVYVLQAMLTEGYLKGRLRGEGQIQKVTTIYDNSKDFAFHWLVVDFKESFLSCMLFYYEYIIIFINLYQSIYYFL